MGRKNRRRRRPRTSATPSARSKPKTERVLLAVWAAAVVGAVVVWLGVKGGHATHTDTKVPLVAPTDRSKCARKVATLGALLETPPEELGDVDVAEMNLLCASGLPGAEKLDIDASLKTLDEWAGRVRVDTERHLYRFQENPAEYKRSEAYFRMLVLVTVLQQDCDVRYNEGRVRDVEFTNSKDLFLHGMVRDDNGGTCVSMPVAYVAVGRRLGYPLKLALAKGHIFCRWDGAGEHLNIEATNRGMNTYEDDFYRSWPQNLTPAEVASGRFLRSLTPPEELVLFLASRGHCLLDNGRFEEARAVYRAAHRLAPIEEVYLAWERQAAARLRPTPAPRAIPGPEPRIPGISKRPGARVPEPRGVVPAGGSLGRVGRGVPEVDPTPPGPRR